MASTLIFSPLPSTAFLHKTHSSSSHSLLSFSPTSISISTSRRTTPFLHVSSSAVEHSFASAKTSSSEVPTTKSGAGDGSLDISKLGISEEIVSALARRGITQLFPIQRAVLDPAMEGRDMIGRAITGSGKTLAFGIPILDKIIQNRSPRRQKQVPSALVLAPTRELARQVQKEFKESAPKLSSACLYGGVPIMSQMRELRYGIDIAVGTPGRIIDLVERGALDLSEVKFVVLDEADQMLAVGFQDDVESILGYLPSKRQSMLFSATMPSWVTELSRKYLRNPIKIDLVGGNDQKLADGISLYSVASTNSGKENILPELITKYGKGGKSIIFTRTKVDAEELSRSIRSTLSSRALHGNMQQVARDRTLAAFRDGRFSVLVATDVAARGLDIPNVDLVIHYEIPNSSEIFVHRSGRTGRAGRKGTAVLMYTRAQRRAVSTIERDLGCKFEELPKIADGIGSRVGRMDMEESSYARYDSPRPRGGRMNMNGSGYGRYDTPRPRTSRYADQFADDQYGSSEGSRGRSYSSNENRNRDSAGPRRFGNSGHSNLSRDPGSRSTRPSNSRTQFRSYDDYEENNTAEKNTAGRGQDGFQQILDMLKEQL